VKPEHQKKEENADEKYDASPSDGPLGMRTSVIGFINNVETVSQFEIGQFGCD
jgi:hypothetical protein